MTVGAQHKAFGDFRFQPRDTPTVADCIRQGPILLYRVFMVEIQACRMIFATLDAPEAPL
jgi:hypothetical protein